MSASNPAALTRRLAELIHGIGADAVTPLALSQAKMCLIDAVGVSLAGCVEPATQVLLRTPGIATAPGRSLVLGTTLRTSALDAALVNGTSAHALDYDDFSSIMGGHHTVPLMPALMALGEEHALSGRDLLVSYIAGVEVQIRMARALGFHHYDKGWHPTSTIGTFGAAAAVAHLMRLDVGQTATALAIAASLASGLKANFGTMVKPFHAGHCGRNGLLAALLAARGFDANESALEHHQGFLNVFNGPGTFDTDRLFADWASPLEIEGETIALKQFPCCGSTHPAIAMMLRLVREEGLRASDVAGIDVLPHARRLRHTDNPWPQSSLEAKFSVQYATVRALLDGAVRLRHFEGAAHEEAEVRRLLEITRARPHPDMADDAEEQWGAEVVVSLRNGKRLSRRIEQLVGRGGKSAMSREEMWTKFEDCGERLLPRDRLHDLFDRLDGLESIADVNTLTRLLEPVAT
ncbi:MmgE/PrpD family protein [Piscinibacter sakaiensis]|uniref:MmgE/PrpD family protein n=1 Tax=Piscinibacter sakaiensis TaxID=1547922 RepID=UPI003AAD3294